MLIRSNTLNESEAISRSKLLNDPVAPTPLISTANYHVTTVSKAPQNRYEALFIKLFAQTTLQLILSFIAILFSITIIRDFVGKLAQIIKNTSNCHMCLFSTLGLSINFLQISFWFQFFLNLSLLIALIFAKMKCISSTYLME